MLQPWKGAGDIVGGRAIPLEEFELVEVMTTSHRPTKDGDFPTDDSKLSLL